MGDFAFPEEKPHRHPEDGVFIEGMFVEAARWDKENHTLVESEAKILYSEAPLIHVIPREVAHLVQYPHYCCPVYKVSSRQGALSTTGHSTNFVMDVRIPSTEKVE